MRVAIDYDGTFTRAPAAFRVFIQALKASGHHVICVTMRPNADGIDIPCDVICTDAARKGHFMEKRGEHVDIWIDDHPEFLF